MLLREGLLAFAGLSAGLVIAAGVFAFLAIIGVFPRLIGKTGSGSHIMLFETVLILGGSLGNAEDLLEYPLGLSWGLVGCPWAFSWAVSSCPWRRP